VFILVHLTIWVKWATNALTPGVVFLVLKTILGINTININYFKFESNLLNFFIGFFKILFEWHPSLAITHMHMLPLAQLLLACAHMTQGVFMIKMGLLYFYLIYLYTCTFKYVIFTFLHTKYYILWCSFFTLNFKKTISHQC
jgi:hypothetical protein